MKCPNCRSDIPNSCLRCPYCNSLTSSDSGRYGATTEPVYYSDDRYRSYYNTEPVRTQAVKPGRYSDYSGYANQNTQGYYGGDYADYNGNNYSNSYYVASRSKQRRNTEMNILLLSLGVINIALQLIILILLAVSLF